jgi:hypothetical protein
MKAGTITAKLRDAVQVRFFEDGAELVQLPSAETNDEPTEGTAEEIAPTANEPTDIELHFNVQGKDRKALVEAMHEILGIEFKYVPGNVCGYVGGGYTIGKDGTVTGAYNAELIEALKQRGYTAQ